LKQPYLYPLFYPSVLSKKTPEPSTQLQRAIYLDRTSTTTKAHF